MQDTTSGWRIVSEDETPAATPPPQTKAKRVPVPKGVKAVEGDYDGDGTLESMWVQPPKMSADKSECIGDSVCRIKFSNPEIPQIVHPDCIGGTPQNLTDLNGGPGDEVGLIPWWFTSCWSGLSVYAHKRGKWFKPIHSIPTHCDTEERLGLAGIPLIEVDRKRLGYVITRSTDFDTFKVVTKSERISR